MGLARLLACGCAAAVLVGCSTSVPIAPATIGPSTTFGPAPSATAAESSPATSSADVSTSGGFTWRAVPMTQFGGVELTTIIAVPDGVLAVGAPYGGSAPLAPSPGMPSLFRSSDGLTWQRLPDSAAFSHPGTSSFDSIASVVPGGSSLLVAVGETSNGDASASTAAAWRSTDGGVSWRRSEVGGATDAAMSDVVTTPHGFVAVGIDGQPTGGTQMIGVRGAAAWTSLDGTRWSRLPTGSTFAGAVMDRIIRAGPNLVAIGGDVPTGAFAAAPPIWHSTDGIHWTRAARPALPGSASIDASAGAWTGSEFVVVGEDELGDRRFLWTSRDGTSWSRSNLELATASSARAVPIALAMTGSTLVLVGFDQPSIAGTFDQIQAGTEADVWESGDGRTWSAIPALSLFSGAVPSRVIPTSTGILVLASTADPSQSSPLWLAVR
jgi:hypothetical protein